MDLEVIGDTEAEVVESVKAYAKFNGIKISGEIVVCMLEPKCYNAKFETVELKKYAVAYADDDNALSIEIIEGEWWKDALMRHKTMVKCWGDYERPSLPDNIEEAKEYVRGFCDFEFDVKEI